MDKPTMVTVQLGDFVKQDIPRREWAVKGVWPEGRSGAIFGAPKAGKSTLALELAISLATGTAWLGHFETSRIIARDKRVWNPRVTYIQAENSNQRVHRDVVEILIARGLGFLEDLHDLDSGRITGEKFAASVPLSENDLLIASNPGLDLLETEHQEVLFEHAKERDYIILDPIYLLASADPNDMGAVMTLLSYLSFVRDNTDCGIIFTHQLSNKQRGGATYARILGSTLYQGWYETAVYTSRTKDGLFHIDVDNLREMGTSSEFDFQGEGVGRWERVEGRDKRGAPNQQKAEKDLRVKAMRKMMAEHPGWNAEDFAEALWQEGLGRVDARSVRRYRTQIEGEMNAAAFQVKQALQENPLRTDAEVADKTGLDVNLVRLERARIESGDA